MEKDGGVIEGRPCRLRDKTKDNGKKKANKKGKNQADPHDKRPVLVSPSNRKCAHSPIEVHSLRSAVAAVFVPPEEVERAGAAVGTVTGFREFAATFVS